MARTKCTVFLGKEETKMQFIIPPRKGEIIEIINTADLDVSKKIYTITSVTHNFSKTKNEWSVIIDDSSLIIHAIETKGL
jgi:molybdenum cofactor biosynthesis enzyme